MKELQICLENCDVIKVHWESVVNLSIYKVHKTYHFAKNMNLEILVADDILLTLSKSADLPHQEFGISKFTTNFKRLYDYRDIVSLTLVHDDDKEEEFYVTYEEDELRCYNKLQSVEFDSYENLVIKIGKDVCSW